MNEKVLSYTLLNDADMYVLNVVAPLKIFNQVVFSVAMDANTDDEVHYMESADGYNEPLEKAYVFASRCRHRKTFTSVIYECS